MKNILNMLCLFLCIQPAIAVEKKENNPAFKRSVQLSVFFAPGVAFRSYNATAHTPIEGIIVGGIWSRDKVMFGYDAGLLVTYRFSPHVAFETGVSYSLKGYSWGSDSLYFASNYPPKPDSIFSLRVSDQYHYFNIPLRLKFHAGKGKVKFIGGAGVSLDFLLGVGQVVRVLYPGQKPQIDRYSTFPTNKNFNIFSISATASAGIDYAINNRMGLRVEPYFSHQFLRTNKNGSIHQYLWNAGLSVAYYFGVK